jgi:hypothetical protein
MKSFLSRLFRRPKMFMLHADFLRAFNLPGKLPITAELRERAGRERSTALLQPRVLPRLRAGANSFLDRFKHDADTPYF